jgi:hypothetical protein
MADIGPGYMEPEVVESLMDRGWTLIQRYRNMLEGQAYSHAFLTERQYENLVPTEWREVLGNASVEEITQMSSGQVPTSAPQSLRDFIVGAHKCRPVPRAASSKSATEWTKTQTWRRGAGPKKVTECIHLGQRVQELAAASTGAAVSPGSRSDSYIVDIGCGKGYLSSMLASEGWRVLALDGRAALTTAASSKDKAPASGRRPAGDSEQLPKYTAMRLGQGGSNGGGPSGSSIRVKGSVPPDGGHSGKEKAHFKQSEEGCQTCSVLEAAIQIPALLTRYFGEGDTGRKAPVMPYGPGVVLVALHACGALSNSCLELCVEAAAAGWLKGAVIVGCCYGLLEEPADWPRSAMMRRVLERSRLSTTDETDVQEPTLDVATASEQLGMVMRDKACHTVVALACDPNRWARHVALTNGYRAALWAAAEHFELGDLGYEYGTHDTTSEHRDSLRTASFARPKFRRALTGKLIRAEAKGQTTDFGEWAAPILNQWQLAAQNEQRERMEDQGGEVNRSQSHGSGISGGDVAMLVPHQVVLPSVAELNKFFHSSPPSEWSSAGSECSDPYQPGSIAHACTRQIFVLEGLCACLWPVVEALLVLDRMQYTCEMFRRGQQQPRPHQPHQPQERTATMPTTELSAAELVTDMATSSDLCQQWDVCIEEVFPSELSPRNLAIVVRRRSDKNAIEEAASPTARVDERIGGEDAGIGQHCTDFQGQCVGSASFI